MQRLIGSMLVAVALAAMAGVAAAQPPCPRVDLTYVEPRATPETRPVKLDDTIVFVRENAIATAGDIAAIKVEGDDFDTLILIEYTEPAAARVLAATTDNAGVRLAFVVDDDVARVHVGRPLRLGARRRASEHPWRARSHRKSRRSARPLLGHARE